MLPSISIRCSAIFSASFTTFLKVRSTRASRFLSVAGMYCSGMGRPFSSSQFPSLSFVAIGLPLVIVLVSVKFFGALRPHGLYRLDERLRVVLADPGDDIDPGEALAECVQRLAAFFGSLCAADLRPHRLDCPELCGARLVLRPAGEVRELGGPRVDLRAQACDERAALLCRELLGTFDLVTVAQHVAVGFVVHPEQAHKAVDLPVLFGPLVGWSSHLALPCHYEHLGCAFEDFVVERVAVVVAHEFLAPHYKVREQAEVAAADLGGAFDAVAFVLGETALDERLYIGVIQELCTARCADAAVQLGVVVLVALDVLFEARHAAESDADARLVVDAADEFERTVGQVLGLVDDDQTARVVQLVHDAHEFFVQAPAFVKAEFGTEFVEESLGSVAVVSLDKDDAWVGLGECLQRGCLSAARFAREHPADLVAEHQRAELVDGLEALGLHDAFALLDGVALRLDFQEVLHLLADGVDVAGIGALDEVAERCGAYAHGVRHLGLRCPGAGHVVLELLDCCVHILSFMVAGLKGLPPGAVSGRSCVVLRQSVPAPIG